MSPSPAPRSKLRRPVGAGARPPLRAFLIGLPLAAVLFSSGRADVLLAPLFQDHAVLQCDQPLPVWGRAAPGEEVTVTFRRHRAVTRTAADGRWLVRLPPLAAGPEPGELVVAGRNTVRLTDILVGEVWLCSGQSNMEYPVNPERVPPDNLELDNQAEETAAANFPLIRNFKVARMATDQPAGQAGGTWAVCTPAAMRHFTAVGYFFARDLHRDLGVPVGIIDSSWGGTPVESWLSEGALASQPGFHGVAERWTGTLASLPARQAQHQANLAAWQQHEAEARAAGPGALAAFHQASPRPRPPRQLPGSQWAPSSLYNGMIAPLIPYALRGVLWYQGESNVRRAGEYGALFRALIRQWRQDWNQGDFPFYFVQLASYEAEHERHDEWAFLREAQASALTLPATGMAVAIDNPDPHNLHPGNKQVIGHRLALIAGAQVYDREAEWSGPVLASARREGSAFRLTFTHADGLVARSRPLTGFAVAGADRVFHPARARIEGSDVLVATPAVPAPVAVRHAWGNAPATALVNAAGLPAGPFRTDDW